MNKKAVGKENIELKLFTDLAKYTRFLDDLDGQKFDVLIIDGRDRYLTVEKVFNCVKEGGFLIYDNSDWYPEACNFLRQQGYVQVDFCGFGPSNDYTWCTSIFFKGNIKFKHRYGMKFTCQNVQTKPDDGKKE